MTLAKREAGTPLSEAELKQRREAARSRWADHARTAATTVAAIGGAVAGGMLADRVSDAVQARGVDRYLAAREAGRDPGRFNNRAAEGAMNRMDRARERSIQSGFTQAPESEVGSAKALSPVTRRLRQLRRKLHEANETIRLDQAGLAAGVPPEALPDATEAYATRKEAIAEGLALKGARPSSRVKVSGSTPVRRKAEWTQRRRGRGLSETVRRGELGEQTVGAAAPATPEAAKAEHRAATKALDNQRRAEAQERKRQLKEWVGQGKDEKDFVANLGPEWTEREKALRDAQTEARNKMTRTLALTERAEVLRTTAGEMQANEAAAADAAKALARARSPAERASAERAVREAEDRMMEAAQGLHREQKRAAKSLGRMGVKREPDTIVRFQDRVGKPLKARAGTVRRQKSSLPARDLKRIRRELRADKLDALDRARPWVERELGPRLGPAFAARVATARRALINAQPARGWQWAAFGAGATLGAAGAGYLVNRALAPSEKPLAKAAPAEESKPDPEAALGVSIAAMLTSWLGDPQRVGSEADLEAALAPAADAFLAGADAVRPPPPGETGAGGASRVIEFDFDSRHPGVERRLREYGLDLIREISESSREAIRTALLDGAMQGLPVEEQARRLRESIGLSRGQKGWVTSYRRQLESLDSRVLDRALRDRRHDRPIARAIEEGTPLEAEAIDKYVSSYHRRALAYRATSIARTEALRAANLGGVAQAAAFLDEMPEYTVEKKWLATMKGDGSPDERTRETHAELHGKTVIGIDTPFLSTDERGNPCEIRYPHDPAAPPEQTVQCRCTVTFQLVRKPSAGRLIAEAVEA